MFDWCKKVEIYNIENHYHFYVQPKQSNIFKNTLQISKLKPAPIQISTHSPHKRNSHTAVKRGLKLSTRLVEENNSLRNWSEQENLTFPIKIGDEQSTDLAYAPNNLENFTLKTEHSETYSGHPSRFRKSKIYGYMPQMAMRTGSRFSIQKIESTPKPKLSSSISKNEPVLPAFLPLKNLTSTMETYTSRNKNPNTISQ